MRMPSDWLLAEQMCLMYTRINLYLDMIIDSIDNLQTYSFLPYIKEINDFINSNNLFELSSGDIPIIGDDLYVKVLNYKPQKSEKGFFETHDHYADLQFVHKGTEVMQYVGREQIQPTDKFKLDGDFDFFEASEFISDLVVKEGNFTVFFPGEPHKPGCLSEYYDGEVKKLVFKIKI